MANRMTRAGEIIHLRAQFKDDYGDVIQAEDVFVHIFEPDADYTDLGNAYLVSGIPVYLGQGIFEYEFTVPACGQDGTWHDLWQGSLLCQDLTGLMSFDVTTSGVPISFENQLFTNDIVQLTLTSGIRAMDGSSLEESYDLEFMTITSPSYTTPRKVRMEIGGFISSIPDYIIQMAIVDASLEANAITFVSTTNETLYNHARYEYVTCVTAAMMMTNVGSLLLRSKTLADLRVEYDTNGVRDAMDKLKACMETWKPQLISGGGSRSGTQPVYVVKGELDPDRPIVSRSWESTEDGDISRRFPAANDRINTLNTRRYKRTWSNPQTKKWW